MKEQTKQPQPPQTGRWEKYLRVCAGACAGLLLLGVICAALLVPRALATLDLAEQVLTQVNEMDWQGLGEAAQKSFEEAGKALEGMDVETLNQAISDLQTVIEPLAQLFGR